MNKILESALQRNNDYADHCGFPEVGNNIAQLLRDIAADQGDDPRERAFEVCEHYDKANLADAEMGKVFRFGKSQQQVSVAVTDRVPRHVEACLSRLSPLASWVLVNESHARSAAATLRGVASIDVPPATQFRPAFMGAATGLDLVVQAARAEVDAALAKLFAADEGDVLGSYHHGDTRRLRIFLHWIPIWLLANRIRASYVDLLRVVLAHEYAHYYMHVGEDADVVGRRRRRRPPVTGYRPSLNDHGANSEPDHDSGWTTESFKETSLDVHEGVAQYFTHLWCLMHDDNAENQWTGGPLQAFKALLERQSEPYTWWQGWSAGPEAVRLAIRSARRHRRGMDRTGWSQLLIEAERNAG